MSILRVLGHYLYLRDNYIIQILNYLNVSQFSYLIILLLGGVDVIETLGGHKTPVLKVVLCKFVSLTQAL